MTQVINERVLWESYMTNRETDNQRRSFEELEKTFTAFRPTLLRYLTARVKNPDDAQDIAQEGFLRLLRVDNIDVIDKLEGYLFRIVTNLANEHLFKKGRSIETLDLDTLIQSGKDGDVHLSEAQMEARIALKHLDRILSDLPPLYRDILLMRKRDGYSHEEIALKVGKSKATVHVYLTRALMRCREQWEKQV